MSKFTVSELDAVEEINEEDLVLVSKKNDDGTYSSAKATITALKAATESSAAESNIGNGTTDTINLFLPTTAFKTFAADFRQVEMQVKVEFPLGYVVVESKNSADIGKDAGKARRQKYSTSSGLPTTQYLYESKKGGWVLKSNDQPAATGGWKREDIGTDEFNESCKVGSIISGQASSANKREEQIKIDADNYLLEMSDFTKSETSSGLVTTDIATGSGYWKSTDVGTEIFDYCCKAQKTLPVWVGEITDPNLAKTISKYVSDNLIDEGDIGYTYTEVGKTSPAKLDAGLKNATLYTQEIEIPEDAAVYVYGSFTCDTTTSKGAAYAIEIQVKCDYGADDTDTNWYTIYRTFSTTDANKNRTSFNYQLYAKAGIKIRGKITPTGNAGSVYLNLSDMHFTLAKMRGEFIENGLTRALQIPYQDYKSDTFQISRNGAVEFVGAFSYYGNYANSSYDRSNNVYFTVSSNNIENNFKNLHTFQISTKNNTYSSYKYYIAASASNPKYIRFRSAKKLGNNSSYPPYGSNTGVVTFTPLSYTTTNINNELAGSNTLTYRIDNKTTYITSGISDKTKPQSVIGVSYVEYNGNTSTSTPNANLWVKWQNDIYEMADGATSLYYCTTTPSSNGDGTYTINIQNTLSKIRISDQTSRAMQYVASQLTKIDNIGTSIVELMPYCCYKAENLNTVITTGTSGQNINIIGEYAFAECKNLAGSLTFAKLTILGQCAFYNCDNLTGFISPLLTSIGDKAFYNNKKLTNISIPNITTIGKYAFSGSSEANSPNITSITCNKATLVDEYAFKNCDELTTVNMTGNVEIKKQAFYNCKKLTTVNIDNATTIGNNAFGACKTLAKVKAAKLSSIENGAFNSATKCQFDFTAISNPPTLKSTNAFPTASYNKDDCWKVYVPDDALNTYESAQYWKTFNVWNQKKGMYTIQHIYPASQMPK